MLSPSEAEALHRGNALKRLVRAAAALRGIYDDVTLSKAVRVKRGTVGGWWTGAQPQPETLDRIAEATGLSYAELVDYVYRNGPLPEVPSGPTGLREGARRAEERPDDVAPGTPARSPRRPPRGVD